MIANTFVIPYDGTPQSGLRGFILETEEAINFYKACVTREEARLQLLKRDLDFYGKLEGQKAQTDNPPEDNRSPVSTETNQGVLGFDT
jgi:hypothetical protein